MNIERVTGSKWRGANYMFLRVTPAEGTVMNSDDVVDELNRLAELKPDFDFSVNFLIPGIGWRASGRYNAESKLSNVTYMYMILSSPRSSATSRVHS